MESINVSRLVTKIVHEYILTLIKLYFLYFKFIKIIYFFFKYRK